MGLRWCVSHFQRGSSPFWSRWLTAGWVFVLVLVLRCDAMFHRSTRSASSRPRCSTRCERQRLHPRPPRVRMRFCVRPILNGSGYTRMAAHDIVSRFLMSRVSCRVSFPRVFILTANRERCRHLLLVHFRLLLLWCTSPFCVVWCGAMDCTAIGDFLSILSEIERNYL